jgi:hypothetical protein
MPLGPGGLDANGVWQYGEDDSEALASDLLNLGMESVSDVIAALPTPADPVILQVVSTTKTDTWSASLGAGVTSSEVTGFTASVTPSSISSKILVTATITGAVQSQTGYILYRDGAPMDYCGDAAGSRTRVSTAAGSSAYGESVTFNYLDSPATTSSTTYSLRILNAEAGTVTAYLNRNPISDGDAAQTWRAASTITVMEIAG